MKGKKALVLPIAIVMAVVFTGCRASNSPLSLAKETMELTAELTANPSKRADIEKRMTEIEARVEKMNKANQLIYAGEIMRLSAEKGGDIFRSAFEGSETQEAIRTFGESLNTPEMQESVRVISDVFGNSASGASSDFVPSQELQDAANLINEMNSMDLQNALQALQGLFGNQ